MAWTFNENFEGFPVGATPYPAGGGSQAVIEDTLVHSGSRALGPAEPGVGFFGTIAVLTDTATIPIEITGWAWCEEHEPIPGDPSWTPDLIAVTETSAGFLVWTAGFSDVDDPLMPTQGHFFTEVSKPTGTNRSTSPAPYAGPGWYRFLLQITDFEGRLSIFSAFYDASGAVVWDSGYVGVAGSATDTGLWTIALDIPTGSAWDDFGEDRDVTRLWPRADGRGLSPGPRIYPPPPSRRIVGGWR